MVWAGLRVQAATGVADGHRGRDEAAKRLVRGARRDDMVECAEEGCEATAAVELHVPWASDRRVCAAHARVAARRDGVVAVPLEGREGEWP